MRWRGKQVRWGGVAWTTAQVIAAAVGAKYGFDFGNGLSGPVLGVVVAANAALFGALAVSALVDAVGRWWPGPRHPARRDT